jgi:hypothetical protein
MKSILKLGFLALLVSGCGAKIGETCKTAGSDECESGAICTNDSTALTCRKTCTTDAECASTEQCNGVSGTNIKSCQPK